MTFVCLQDGEHDLEHLFWPFIGVFDLVLDLECLFARILLLRGRGPIFIVIMHTPLTPFKILICIQTCIQILTCIHTFFGVLDLDRDLDLDLECLSKLYFGTHSGRNLDLECLLAGTLKCFGLLSILGHSALSRCIIGNLSFGVL